jgi:dipeptidyl aminopeptidase/acylaminoacyl peptidase
MVAACLTDQAPPGSDASDLAVDLCTVDLRGRREVIRAGITPGERVALSPDRSRVAFVTDGGVALVGVDGTGETSTGLDGTAPEWLGDDAIAAVAADGRSIVATSTRPTGAEVHTLVSTDVIQTSMPAAGIDTFAISSDGERVVVALHEDRGQPGNHGDDDRFALVRIDVATGDARALIGPSHDVISHPDWHPDGRHLAVAARDGILRVDAQTGETSRIGPPMWVATTPSWSDDGHRLVWLANGVDHADGTAVLVYLDERNAEGPRHIVGDRNRPLDRFPALPDW